MEDKYYTPEIEEFHVGFECEVLFQTWEGGDTEPVSDIQKVIIGGDSKYDRHLEGDFRKNGKEVLEHVRVKYLDREDIEGLGFTYKTIYRDGGTSIFTKGSFELVFKGSNWATPSLSVKIAEGDARDNKLLFFGDVKNKSELKLILKQIGI